MKRALVADLHIHEWREFATLDGADKVNSRLYDCYTVLQDMRLYCGSHDIGVVVIAGDLFHKRGVLYTEAYNRVVYQLAQMQADGLHVLCVDGNHDHANRAGTVHNIDALWTAGLVEGIPKHEGYCNWTVSAEGAGKVIVSGYSYCENPAVFEQRLVASTSEIATVEHEDTARIAVCHHGFRGARVGSALEYQVKEEIDPAVFAAHGFDFIFSGHYHTRQKIGGLPNALYLGSPLEHTRGIGGKKGFTVYDTDTKTTKLVRTRRPRFITLDSDDTADWCAEVINGNFVDVLYSPAEDPATLVKQIEAFGARGVKPVRVVTHKVATKRLDIDAALDTKSVLTRYVDYRKEEIKKAGLIPADVLKLGLDIISRAE